MGQQLRDGDLVKMERIKIWVAIFFYIQSLTPYNRPSESRTLKGFNLCTKESTTQMLYIYINTHQVEQGEVQVYNPNVMGYSPPPLKIWRPVCLTIIYQLIKNKLRDTTWKTREIPVVTEKKD